MAFSINIETDGSKCAKCGKPSTEDRPLLDIWVTGRSWSDRNIIGIHEDCLLKAIAKLKASIKESLLQAIRVQGAKLDAKETTNAKPQTTD